MLPQFQVQLFFTTETKVHCMPFGQSGMCLGPMLNVFSFLRNSDFFSYTLEYENKYWSYCRIKVDKNKKKTGLSCPIQQPCKHTVHTAHPGYHNTGFLRKQQTLRHLFPNIVLENTVFFSTGSPRSNICCRRLLVFRVVKPCVTYPIGQRGKYHWELQWCSIRPVESWSSGAWWSFQARRERSVMTGEQTEGGADRPWLGGWKLQWVERRQLGSGSHPLITQLLLAQEEAS